MTITYLEAAKLWPTYTRMHLEALIEMSNSGGLDYKKYRTERQPQYPRVEWREWITPEEDSARREGRRALSTRVCGLRPVVERAGFGTHPVSGVCDGIPANTAWARAIRESL